MRSVCVPSSRGAFSTRASRSSSCTRISLSLLLSRQIRGIRTSEVGKYSRSEGYTGLLKAAVFSRSLNNSFCTGPTGISVTSRIDEGNIIGNFPPALDGRVVTGQRYLARRFTLPRERDRLYALLGCTRIIRAHRAAISSWRGFGSPVE